jgi:hypothetical protein
MQEQTWGTHGQSFGAVQTLGNPMAAGKMGVDGRQKGATLAPKSVSKIGGLHFSSFVKRVVFIFGPVNTAARQSRDERIVRKHCFAVQFDFFFSFLLSTTVSWSIDSPFRFRPNHFPFRVYSAFSDALRHKTT